MPNGCSIFYIATIFFAWTFNMKFTMLSLFKYTCPQNSRDVLWASPAHLQPRWPKATGPFAIQALCGVQSTDDKSLIFINLKKNHNNILLILAQKPKKTNCLLKIEGEKIYNTSSLSCFCLKKNANQFHVSLFGKLLNWESMLLGRIGDWTMGEIISCTVPVLKKFHCYIEYLN